ncbi:phage replisome organizer N-terminal domain-containing protein [Anaerococcus tetradius]|jgi:hypothetical protein|uniref:phage replisome organizer N-terminal domain-containing protein n=1 Tax=Anaerococcus tetradius TaxID=33036 RepID=UPI00204EB678|nr:phage replisome organizer N-terminal domain-containing protein [Anaerococcus tetradius]DAK50555.1 MAG TPA: replisome organizer [Caudoviricetes sp.]
MSAISWIKLSVNIFDDEKIKLIRSMPEGDAIILIWIQLLCLAGKTNDGGAVYIGQHMNYTDEMIATICDQPLNTVRFALKTFEQFEMINLGDDGLISIANWEKHQNIEGMEKVREQTRKRVARYRERQKALESSNANVTLRNGTDKNKNRLDKNKNRLEIDDNNIAKISEKERGTINYYYRLVKNNTSTSDRDLIISAIKQYGWKRILYTLWYLKYEQKASITSFKYVEKVLDSQKEIDQGVLDFVADREIMKMRKGI